MRLSRPHRFLQQGPGALPCMRPARTRAADDLDQRIQGVGGGEDA